MKTFAVPRSRLRICRLSGITLSVVLLASAMAHGAEATFHAEGGELLVQMPAWTLALDAAKGAMPPPGRPPGHRHAASRRPAPVDHPAAQG